MSIYNLNEATVSKFGAVACTCNLVTMEAEFLNSVGSVPVQVTALQ